MPSLNHSAGRETAVEGLERDQLHWGISMIDPPPFKSRENGEHSLRLKLALQWGIFFAYVILVALVTSRHEMNRDEVQPFILARDAPSVMSLIHRLGYEGHPALWYLILWIPAKLSANPVSLQVLNFVFAAGEAALIISARKVPLFLRGMMLFSLTVVYSYGVLARNYMIALLLLTAAMRLLLANRPRPKPAIGLLALAIQSHFFAIPVALVIFFLFCCPKRWNLGPGASLTRDFLPGALLLLLSLAGTYVTIKPPVDTMLKPQMQTDTKAKLLAHFAVIEGKAWQVILPIPKSRLPASIAERLAGNSPSAAAVILSASLLFLAFGCLQTREAQLLFGSVVLLELCAMTITVHLAPLRHYGFIFAALFFGIMVDTSLAGKQRRQGWIHWSRGSTTMLAAIFAMQAVAGLYACALDWNFPYSEAQETSMWLVRQGLVKHPLVVTPDESIPGITGYLRIAQVYAPACRCFEDSTLRRNGRDLDRPVSREELDRLQAIHGFSPIILSGYPLPDPLQRELGVRLLHAFANQPLDPQEAFFAYGETDVVTSR